ncbi:uncharacterized protein A1O9_08561 [Exophiala aquamarina CBS 119918]|uniref:Uncharacterized protein n=1 Tax=Exophiala aquamarina CBS 119918 TaxID=1182545 RepID=A0A072PJZ9_9EURO|nr:uncharacterized protein A1O9_08561 [Exophiala aquamarina CBS 119918]KEF55810.1 hypothetical protein A1O9_08561 [Exophiala aquamarina CBS 119918]
MCFHDWSISHVLWDNRCFYTDNYYPVTDKVIWSISVLQICPRDSHSRLFFDAVCNTPTAKIFFSIWFDVFLDSVEDGK